MLSTQLIIEHQLVLVNAANPYRATLVSAQRVLKPASSLIPLFDTLFATEYVNLLLFLSPAYSFLFRV